MSTGITKDDWLVNVFWKYKYLNNAVKTKSIDAIANNWDNKTYKEASFKQNKEYCYKNTKSIEFTLKEGKHDHD